jgi:hypothetical protein
VVGVALASPPQAEITRIVGDLTQTLEHSIVGGI